MTTTSDVESISTWVLHVNDNKSSKKETSEAEDNIFNDNEMEIVQVQVRHPTN